MIIVRQVDCVKLIWYPSTKEFMIWDGNTRVFPHQRMADEKWAIQQFKDYLGTKK